MSPLDTENTKTYLTPSNDVEIQVFEAGNPANPSIVFIHGYPDCHNTWSEQFKQLSNRYHLVAFDLRGFAASTWSPKRKSYRIAEILPDIAAVIDASVGKEKSIHLVGHDWGSVLGWSFVSSDEYARRVLSWTSISGPHLGILMQWLKSKLSSFSLSGLRHFFGQLAHSYYVLLFQVPWLPEQLFKRVGRRVWRLALLRGGVDEADPYLDISQSEVEEITINGLGLYRDNLFSPPPAPAERGITTPTQLIIPAQDSFIRPYVFDDLDKYVVDLHVKEIEANHWVHRSHAAVVNGLIDSFARIQGDTDHESEQGQPSESLTTQTG